MPPAVLTQVDRTPPSSPVNTSTTRPIGHLLRTTLSSAKILGQSAHFVLT